MGEGRDEGQGAGTRRYRSRALGRATARLDRGTTASSVSVGEIADRLGHLGPLYLLMAVACVAVSPLSGIPFVTATCGLAIAALSGQLLLNRRTVWLPASLRQRRVPVARLRTGMVGADRVAGAVEAALRRRWVWLTRGPVRAVLLSVCLAFGLMMPFMEVIPFAGSTLASVVLIVALALIARDGLVALTAGIAVCMLLVVLAILVI